MKKFSTLCFAIFCLNLTACNEQTAEIGQPAPDIAVYDLQGNQQSLESFKGKPLLMSFWSETCGVCVKELKTLAQEIQSRNLDIQLLAVNIDSEKYDTRAAVEKHQITMPVVKDQLKMTAERYQVVGAPTTFLIDKNGIVLKKSEGLISLKKWGI